MNKRILFATLFCTLAARVFGATWDVRAGDRGMTVCGVKTESGEDSVSVPAEWERSTVESIGAGAFAGCDGLRSVLVPASVAWIAPDAFRGCPALERIEVGEGCEAYSDVDGILFDGTGTMLLNCPEGRSGELVVPAGTESIDAEAFLGCAALQSVVLPDGIASVGDSAFAECPALSVLSLPKNASCDLSGAGVPEDCLVVRYTPGGLDDPTLPPRWAVAFHANGGTGTMATQVVETGAPEALAACAFSRKGYSFAGWARSASGAAAFANGAVVEDLAESGKTVHLYALWTLNRFKVRFNANGGTGTMGDESFVWGTKKALTSNAFKRTGYTFQGWATTKGGGVVYKNKQAVANLTATANGVVTLYAVWQGVVYTVVYHSNVKKEKTIRQSFRYGTKKALRANTFTRSGCVFIGWAKSSGGAVAYKNGQQVLNLTSVAGREVHLYAKWAVRNYTVRFVANGGSGKMATQAYTWGKAAALRANAFKRTGYTFAGWARKASDPVKYTNKQSVSNLTAGGGTVTLYAKWRRNRYKVAFVTKFGSGTMAPQSFSWGVKQKLSPCAFVRNDDCVFVGWAKTDGGTILYRNAQEVVSLTAKDGATVTLYARWAKRHYAVHFVANGGAGFMPDEPMVYGTAKALTKNAFSRQGYEFLGWAKTASATSPAYKDGASVKNLVGNGSTLSLYAVWVKANDPNIVLCLGDSITQGFRCYGLPYPARLANLSGKRTINCGVGGTTSGDGLKTAEKNIVAAHAATVCIQFGANDAIHGISAKTTKENLRKIIRLCRAHNCRPILATPTHQSGSHARFNNGVNSIVVAVRALAREENVTLVDLNAAFGGNDRYLNPNDGLHLSEAGGALMARKFFEAL